MYKIFTFSFAWLLWFFWALQFVIWIWQSPILFLRLNTTWWVHLRYIILIGLYVQINNTKVMVNSTIRGRQNKKDFSACYCLANWVLESDDGTIFVRHLNNIANWLLSFRSIVPEQVFKVDCSISIKDFAIIRVHWMQCIVILVPIREGIHI